MAPPCAHLWRPSRGVALLAAAGVAALLQPADATAYFKNVSLTSKGYRDDFFINITLDYTTGARVARKTPAGARWR
jgi:hypothetical protein